MAFSFLFSSSLPKRRGEIRRPAGCYDAVVGMSLFRPNQDLFLCLLALRLRSVFAVYNLFLSTQKVQLFLFHNSPSHYFKDAFFGERLRKIFFYKKNKMLYTPSFVRRGVTKWRSYSGGSLISPSSHLPFKRKMPMYVRRCA